MITNDPMVSYPWVAQTIWTPLPLPHVEMWMSAMTVLIAVFVEVVKQNNFTAIGFEKEFATCPPQTSQKHVNYHQFNPLIVMSKTPLKQAHIAKRAVALVLFFLHMHHFHRICLVPWQLKKGNASVRKTMILCETLRRASKDLDLLVYVLGKKKTNIFPSNGGVSCDLPNQFQIPW